MTPESDAQVILYAEGNYARKAGGPSKHNEIEKPGPCSRDQLKLEQVKVFFVTKGYEASTG